ncbi:MAG: hypothetical protein ACP5G2_07905 [Candidatus Bipolaricaulaceae bacterium]
MATAVELARYLLRAVSERPEDVRVEHVWTPKTDLLFLQLPSSDRKRLRRRELAMLSGVIERLGREEGRELVVDLR